MDNFLKITGGTLIETDDIEYIYNSVIKPFKGFLNFVDPYDNTIVLGIEIDIDERNQYEDEPSVVTVSDFLLYDKLNDEIYEYDGIKTTSGIEIEDFDNLTFVTEYNLGDDSLYIFYDTKERKTHLIDGTYISNVTWGNDYYKKLYKLYHDKFETMFNRKRKERRFKPKTIQSGWSSFDQDYNIIFYDYDISDVINNTDSHQVKKLYIMDYEGDQNRSINLINVKLPDVDMFKPPLKEGEIFILYHHGINDSRLKLITDSEGTIFEDDFAGRKMFYFIATGDHKWEYIGYSYLGDYIWKDY